MMKKKVLIYIITLLSSISVFGGTLVEQGDSAYLRKEYHYAIKNYEEAITKDGVSAEIYYNLGNAYYKSGNIAKAILNYERALRLKADYTEAKENLAFVKKQTNATSNQESKFFEIIVTMFSSNAWGWISLSLFIITSILFGSYLYFEEIGIRKIGFFGGGIFIILFIITLTISIISANRSLKQNKAIIMDNNVPLCSAPHSPNNNSEELGIINSGAKVEIIDSISTPNDSISNMWYEVKFDSKKAWIRANSIEKI